MSPPELVEHLHREERPLRARRGATLDPEGAHGWVPRELVGLVSPTPESAAGRSTQPRAPSRVATGAIGPFRHGGGGSCRGSRHGRRHGDGHAPGREVRARAPGRQLDHERDDPRRKAAVFWEKRPPTWSPRGALRARADGPAASPGARFRGRPGLQAGPRPHRHRDLRQRQRWARWRGPITGSRCRVAWFAGFRAVSVHLTVGVGLDGEVGWVGAGGRWGAWTRSPFTSQSAKQVSVFVKS